jgi:uncharacterized DUF497 family protein
MTIRYTWDPKKNATNRRKHGVTFEVAIRVFEGFTVEDFDERYEYEEIRQSAIGVVNDIEFFVVFTDVSDEERRIITARPATREEREVYWQTRRRHV